MKVHLGRQILEKGFRTHLLAAGCGGLPPGSATLLLCYAVECGLKLVLLIQRSLYSTERLDDDDLTHDLDRLGAKVGCRERIGHIVTAQPAQMKIECQYIHVLFRYGGKLTAQDSAALQARLQGVALWIEEQL
jgi:hypothetical protein